MNTKLPHLTPRFLIPELRVADVDAALTYYRDVLGFSVEGRHEDESGHVVFGSVLCGCANFYFSKCDEPPSPTRCWVGVGEVDALSEHFATRGARITEGVEDKPWGYRQFTVKDPDGHLLTFFRFSDDATGADDREIIITRTFDAPRELVWRAWTEPELIERWWGPRDFDTRVEQHELYVGGQWRYVMVGPDGNEYPAVGTFSEIVPMDRFVTTSEFGEDFIARTELDLPKGAMLTVAFEDLGEKTRVTLRMTHRSADDRRKHEEMGVVPGWNSSFDCLDELLDAIS